MRTFLEFEKPIAELEGKIKELRVGKVIVKDVECGVMPEGFSKGHPALGQSFLRNFNYRIDSDAATLTMTKIDTD